MIDMIKNGLAGVIEHALGSWIESVINWVLKLINGMVFNVPDYEYINTIFNFLTWFSGIFAVVLASYKGIEYMLNEANGTQQYPLGELFLRIGKSGASILILPWIFKTIIVDIALPIANYFATVGSDFDDKGGYAVMTGALVGAGLGISTGGIVILLMMILFAVAFISFLFSVCVFYADYVMMHVLIAPVALSMIADDNNYFNVWWRELLTMVVALLTKIFLLTVIINVLFTGGGMIKVLTAIGCAVLLIKTPSILKNMWYGGGSTKAVARGGGQVANMGSRMVMTQMFR
ncbi:conjugal transfer protein TrbL family protein [Bacillus altitudinis]|uniref:conjugal transfer protein TrbL family protein n=1 Tax=Bacillus altitudinis TaxID=293387 RepID=UPI0020BD759B|nr:conjugal transfer protein TrbL family protein [Bacillus altitudinis]